MSLLSGPSFATVDSYSEEYVTGKAAGKSDGRREAELAIVALLRKMAAAEGLNPDARGELEVAASWVSAGRHWEKWVK
jgi:hypothetical protein